jgi:hypothetical protein
VPAFQAFVQQAGARYRTTVDTWSIWNEPNLDGWLAPKGLSAVKQYRSLYRAGVAGLKASGNGGDRILLGELAPVASSRATAPVTFYRDLFCISSRGRKLTGSAAKARGCTGFKKLTASGVAHHPYTPAAACSPRCKGGSRDITIASLSRLAGVLDQAARAGRLSSGARLHLWLTEAGFRSNAPMSPSKQAAYINWSEWTAFTSSRVSSYPQYELKDPGAKVFNTGLRFQNWAEKPAYAAYRTPLFVVRSGKSVKVFGGARPGGAHTVRVQARGKSGFKTVKTVTTNGAGYLYVRLGYRKSWRLTWTSGGTTFVSRIAGVV